MNNKILPVVMCGGSGTRMSQAYTAANAAGRIVRNDRDCSQLDEEGSKRPDFSAPSYDLASTLGDRRRPGEKLIGIRRPLRIALPKFERYGYRIDVRAGPP
jgi:hypothetical protein